MYDLAIIGGGPGGVAAGVYAARKKINTILITEDFGGQSLISPGIENWIGDQSISGLELAKRLESHIRKYEKLGDVELIEKDLVESISKQKNLFSIKTKKGKEFQAKTILITSGSRRRRLGVPGEDKLDGKGVAWCATCDAPIFQGMSVAVIGGGNAGLESVLTLAPYANKIYLLQRRDSLKGDLSTQEKVLKLPTIEVIFNAETQEILGDKLVSGLRYKDLKTGEEKILEVGGVFIEIGSMPNIEFIKDLVQIDQWNQIVIDSKTQQTSLEGVWAAGDVTDVIYKQNNISVGDAIKAVLNIFDYLHKK